MGQHTDIGQRGQQGSNAGSADRPPHAAEARQEAPSDERNDLVVEHLHLVQHVVNQVATRYPRHVDRQELWNAGAFGLVDASRRYDPTVGIPFSRYCMIRIRGAIIDSTRSRDWATRAVRRSMREVRAATEAFEHANGRAPTTVELATSMGVDAGHVEACQQAARTTSLLHLDQRVGGGEADDATLGDLVEEQDTEMLPQDELERRELTGTLRAAITHLPDVQRDVVRRYYFEGEFLRDIADTLGVTEARVSQIRSEALNAVRAYFATAFEGVPAVDEKAPGLRARAAFVEQLVEHTNWRERLAAADAVPAALSA